MSFAFASCADYQEGYFPAYRAIAEEEDLDVVFHLGDYICEYAPDPDSTRVAQTPAKYRDLPQHVRRAEARPGVASSPYTSLEVIPDDHEVYNNFEGPADRAVRRPPPPGLLGAHALKALRRPTFEGGVPNLTLYPTSNTATSPGS